MAKYNVHNGHNKKVPGIISYLNEVTENRKIGKKVIQFLKQAKHTVYDCTDDAGKTQSANLSNIVKKCNKHNVLFNVSLHLNGFKKVSEDGKNKGVEILLKCKDATLEKVANRILKNMVALGFTNRGIKYRTDLYVLNHTDDPTMLIEVCFADDKDDVNLYNKVGVDKIALAIAEGIHGKEITTKKATAVKTKYYDKYTGSSTQVDVVFKAIGVPAKYRGSVAARKPVAKKNGYLVGYKGAEKQNLKLISLAKKGKLKKV